MMHNKNIAMICMAGALLISVAATSPMEKVNEFKNLKVLPKNISQGKLEEIMVDEFEDGLGVNCAFCHATKKGSNSLDYASDEKPEKKIARGMMQMSLKLNKKYFHIKNISFDEKQVAVTCNTCHRGQPRPEMVNGK